MTKNELFEKNPWRDLVKCIENNNFRPLEKNIFSEKEGEIIDKFNEELKNKEFTFRSDVLPEPYWGNVLDAKVVILTLNPGYIKRVNADIYELLSEDHKTRFIKEKLKNLLFENKNFVSKEVSVNAISDYYWEDKTKELFPNNSEPKAFEELNSKIAFIQFIPYHSVIYKGISKKYLNEDNLLPSQKFTVELIKYLIEEKRIIIIARAKDLWVNAVKELADYSDLVELKNNRQTHISKNNCKDGKFELILNALK